MVLGGPWGKHESGGPGRVFVNFQTVTIMPSESDTEASIDMVSKAGLNISTPIPLKGKGCSSYIDVEYIDRAVRVHKGASGATYVLSREDVPFKSPSYTNRA